jgi:ribosomal protein S18 acetylase RimI-like enzyme
MIETIRVFDFQEFYEDHQVFLAQRYDEAKEICKSTRNLDMDIELWQQLIDNNTITVLEIFKHNSFIGYCSIVIAPSLLKKGKVDARVDHLALSPEERKKGTATTVLDEIESLLSAEGVDQLGLILPPTEMHNNFAQASGYNKEVVFYTKSLEVNNG